MNTTALISLALATIVSAQMAPGDDDIVRTAEQIAAARDFGLKGVSFESSYADIKAAFPKARNAPAYKRRFEDAPVLEILLDDRAKAYVQFTRKARRIREFEIIYGETPLKKAGGLNAAQAKFETAFGEPDEVKEEKMNNDKLSSFRWRFDSVDRDIMLQVRNTLGEEAMFLTVVDTSAAESPAP